MELIQQFSRIKRQRWQIICKKSAGGKYPFRNSVLSTSLSFQPGHREVRLMAKIVFKFFEVNVKDDDVAPFLKKMEEVLKQFAGEAYHFRYYLEEPSNASQSRTQENDSKRHNVNRDRRF